MKKLLAQLDRWFPGSKRGVMLRKFLYSYPWSGVQITPEPLTGWMRKQKGSSFKLVSHNAGHV
jgi:hypothetical protein